MAELMTGSERPQPAPDALPQTPAKPAQAVDKKELDEKVVKHFKSRLEASDRNTDNFRTEWKRNVDLRLGRPDQIYTAGVDIGAEDNNQTSINPDWSLTKMKTANLYSQLPSVQVTHESNQFAKGVAPFTKALNYQIGDKGSKLGTAMTECLNDMVNASGVGAIVIGYSARFEKKMVPVQQEMVQQFESLTPEQQQHVIDNKLIPMREVSFPTSTRFPTNRISPMDLRTPVEFVGSDFNQGPWIGHRGRMSWADALHDLGVKEDQKDKVVGGQAKANESISLRSQPDEQGLMELEVVNYACIYYWRCRVDPDEKSFDAIWKIVWVDGLTEPTIHEPWKGQKWNAKTHQYAGATKFPIQVGTLTYITDNPIPPSDTSAGRPQVNDMRRSRQQMFMNRDRSVPVRGFNSVLVHPDVRDNLMRGNYQGWIPFNGPQKDAIWEVARASYPAEDLSFDRQTKADLMESWQVAPGGGDGGTTKTKAEVQASSQAFSVVVGQERAKVQSFFLNVVEVVAGLMALYSDFPNLTEEERQAMMQAWPVREVSPDFVLSVRPDSMITLAPEQRIERLLKYLNMTVKSGMVNPMPILEEITELSGLDPAKVLKQPDPPKPPETKIALRLNGKHDVNNPVSMALVQKSGHAISDEDLNNAKKLLLKAQNPNPDPPQQQPGQGGPPGPPQPGPLNKAHQGWTLANKIAKRSRDIGGGANPGGGA